MSAEEMISVDAEICSGKPVVRGTRILVRNVLGIFAGGGTIDDVLEAYPELNEEQVRAAVEYAVRVLDEEKVLLID